MNKKFFILVCFVLVFGLVGNAAAQGERENYWTGSGGDYLWCNPDNWLFGEPVASIPITEWEGDWACIETPSISDPVLISEGCDAQALTVIVGNDVDVGYGLNMTGGTLTTAELLLGYDEGGVGVMRMSGGSLAMAPAYVIAQLCDYVDLDGPLLQNEDVEPGVIYSAGRIFPSSSGGLWAGI